MKLFGYDFNIKKIRSEKKKKFLYNLLSPWQHNKEVFTDDNFYAMVKAYRSWVYICANRNATTCASVPLRLYIAKDSNTKIKGYGTKSLSLQEQYELRKRKTINDISAVRMSDSIEEVLEHPFLDLMKNVNPFTNGFDLWEITDLYQELTGNSFWYIVKNKLGVPQEIWPIPPQNCRIIASPTDFIKEYKLIKGSNEITLKESDVVHFKFPNPNNLFYGASPLTAIKEAVYMNDNIYTYENAIFNNMGRLDGVFETDQELSDHEFERLKEEIKQQFQGASNAGQAPLLEKGVKYKSTGLPPKEMGHLSGRSSIKEEIVNAYGQSLGMYDKDATRANSVTAVHSFLTSAIVPRLTRMEQKLNEKLIPLYDNRLFVAFDNPVSEERDKLLEERIKHVSFGIESINEIRKKINLEPFDSRFDEPLIPVNMSTMENIINNGVDDSSINEEEKPTGEAIEEEDDDTSSE